jgi:uncharacterized protein
MATTGPTATATPRRHEARPAPTGVTPEQHPLGLSVLLHLLPGAALTVFIVIAINAFGVDAMAALLLGIPLGSVPIELGYLTVQARRTTGSWSPWRVVSYRAKLPRRKLALYATGLFAWFMLIFVVSTVFLDDWIAANLLAWLPDAILQFSVLEGAGEGLSGTALALAFVFALAFNGVVGPVTEELYFRGHLLPRIDRYGRKAPVLNTVLFSLYHFWTPWQNPARIIGLLPMVWSTWRKRSVYLAMAVHIAVNTVGVLLLFALILGGAA